jgi:hypothetical protein
VTKDKGNNNASVLAAFCRVKLIEKANGGGGGK